MEIFHDFGRHLEVSNLKGRIRRPHKLKLGLHTTFLTVSIIFKPFPNIRNHIFVIIERPYGFGSWSRKGVSGQLVAIMTFSKGKER